MVTLAYTHNLAQPTNAFGKIDDDKIYIGWPVEFVVEAEKKSAFTQSNDFTETVARK